MGQNFESGKSSGWWSDVWNIKNVQIFPHARLCHGMAVHYLVHSSNATGVNILGVSNPNSVSIPSGCVQILESHWIRPRSWKVVETECLLIFDPLYSYSVYSQLSFETSWSLCTKGD